MAEELDLSLKIRALVDGVDKVNRLARDLRGLGNQAGRQIPDPFSRVRAGLQRTTRLFGGIRREFLSLRTLIAGGLVIGAARSVIRTASDFQQLRVQLETVFGTAERASAEFERILEFARSTPFEVQNITNAVIRLRAVGIEPTEELMRSIGDTAAAFGKDITDFTDAVIGAATGEFERLKQFGIVARVEGDRVKFIFNGLERSVRRDTRSIVSFLQEMGETRFAGGMEDQVNTLRGAFSNLQDATAALADEVGRAGLVDALTEVTREITDMANGADGAAESLGRGLAEAVREIFEQVKNLSENMDTVRDAVAFLLTVRFGSLFGPLGASAAAAAAGVGILVNRLREANEEIIKRELDRDLKPLEGGFQVGDNRFSQAEIDQRLRRAQDLPRTIDLGGDGAAGDTSDGGDDKRAESTFNRTQAIADLNRALDEERQRLEEVAQSAQAVVDRLFPAQAAARQFAKELELIEQSDLAADKKAEAIRRLQEELAAATGGNRQLREEGERELSQLSEFGIQAARNMQTAFADFFFDPLNEGFEGLVSGFSDALRRMAAELAAQQFLNGLLGASFSQTGQLGGVLGAIFAQGGVFGPGRTLTPFAAGGVIDRPVVFPFAQGIGLAGEAGPEAIMPLKRGPGGDLGVEAVGGGGGLTVEINNYSDAKVSQPEYSEGADGRQLLRLTIEAVASDVRNGGSVSRSIQNTFGLGRPGTRR